MPSLYRRLDITAANFLVLRPSNTMTPEVLAQITKVIKNLPPEHLIPPQNNVAVSDPALFWNHLNDFAFT